MSYNHDPEWTKDIKLPSALDFRCPGCGHAPSQIDMDECELYSVGYYKPRHIAPYLRFTCYNEECPRCDEDFKVYLRCVVTVTRIEVVK